MHIRVLIAFGLSWLSPCGLHHKLEIVTHKVKLRPVAIPKTKGATALFPSVMLPDHFPSPAVPIAHSMYSGFVSAKLKLKCPVSCKVELSRLPFRRWGSEAEIGFGDDERTQTGQGTLTNSVISTDLRSGIRGFLQQAIAHGRRGDDCSKGCEFSQVFQNQRGDPIWCWP